MMKITSKWSIEKSLHISPVVRWQVPKFCYILDNFQVEDVFITENCLNWCRHRHREKTIGDHQLKNSWLKSVLFFPQNYQSTTPKVQLPSKRTNNSPTWNQYKSLLKYQSKWRKSTILEKKLVSHNFDVWILTYALVTLWQRFC